MKKFYDMEIAGLKRRLPLCPISDSLDIAAFIMFSDVELTIAAALELIKIIPECDILITAECKGIPLAYEMAKQMKLPYIVARKSAKLYMNDPIIVDVQSITTVAKQALVLDRNEAELLTGKRVVIVDDVISTGESLAAVEKLVEFAHGQIVGKCSVLAEGDAALRDDIIFLEKLPLFFK